MWWGHKHYAIRNNRLPGLFIFLVLCLRFFLLPCPKSFIPQFISWPYWALKWVIYVPCFRSTYMSRVIHHGLNRTVTMFVWFNPFWLLDSVASQNLLLESLLARYYRPSPTRSFPCTEMFAFWLYRAFFQSYTSPETALAMN